MLWHQASNNYSIVSQEFTELLEHYLKASNRADFIQSLNQAYDFDAATASALELQITELLEAANTVEQETSITPPVYSIPKTVTTQYYKSFGISFEIIADHAALLHYVHPALAHLETEQTDTSDAVFYINEHHNHLHLFLNGEHYGSFKKDVYHLLQGRFVMLLLGVLHQQPDSKWLASFHASTIAKNGKAVMLVGASGKGKSTLTALLAFNGFEFVADDVTGMLYDSLQVFSYPAAISVKAGAFEALHESIPQLKSIPLASKHPKGAVKFLPVPEPQSLQYPCHQIVLVHYSQEPIAAKLEPIPMVKALELLIPDTWISPQATHAKAFLDWLSNLKAYELHYHHNIEAIEIMDDLFKS